MTTTNYWFAFILTIKVITWIFRSKVSIKFSQLRLRLSSSCFFREKREILNIYGSIDAKKLTTIFIKKIIRKTQINCSLYNALKTLKTLKKRGKKLKNKKFKKKDCQNYYFYNQKY